MISAIFEILVLPALLGLLGFVEPCSIGSALLFLRYVSYRPAVQQRDAALIFLVARALMLGLLGAAATTLGASFEPLRLGGWLLLGSIYLSIGTLYLTGHAAYLFRSVGAKLSSVDASKGTFSLGVLFGMNVPACAAPLLAVLLGQAALGAEPSVARGFVTLAVFGAALSAPLLLALWWPAARRLLDRVSRWADRVPIVLGLALIAVGAWSIYQGLAL